MPRKLNPHITPEQRAKNTEKKRRWREANPEHVKAKSEQDKDADRKRQQAWVAENRESHNEYHRAWADKRRRKAGVPERRGPRTPEEKREYHRQWRLDHPGKAAAYTADWRSKNPEYKSKHKPRGNDPASERARERARQKWASLSDDEKLEWNAYSRQRYAEDLEASREYTKLRSHRRRARAAAAPGRFTPEQIEDLYARQNKKCATCKKRIYRSGDKICHIDHVQPLYRGGSNDISNIQLLCQKCNLSKGYKDPDVWAREHGLLFL